MTAEEFPEAVRQMRSAQRAFFASAQGTPARQKALRESKGLEKRVDAFLAGKPEQAELPMEGTE